MKRLLLIACLALIPTADAADDDVHLTAQEAARMVARYQAALQAAIDAQEEAEKAKRLAIICLAGWGGLK